jgi:urease accessory protein
VSDAHRAVLEYSSEYQEKGDVGTDLKRLDDIIKILTDLDELYQAMTLNHVSRRASMSQGVALLTLYSKGFSRPPTLSAFWGAEPRDHESHMRNLFDQFKLKVRREEVFGHLPICWGALTAALGLKLERAQYLHLFLHARSLLSASIRLNNLGPYGAQQLLLHAIRPLVAAEAMRCRNLQTGLLDNSVDGLDEVALGPANTWPLGEILAGRHDLQHSRIFNS